jgi:OmpA-OmpF porin, OOP family
VQYSLTDQWAVQADFRRAQTYLRGETFGFDRARTNVASLGVVYTFDKPNTYTPVAREAPPPAPMAQAPAAPMAAPAPAPIPAPPAPAPAPPQPRTERYTLSDVELFAFDSAQLRSPQPKLDEIAMALNQNAQVGNVVITGYTDRLGSEAYNLKLSQQRADAVKQYLADKGVGAPRLSAIGRGEASPKVMCNDRVRKDLIECLAPNRRVEVEQITIERRVP